MVNKIIEEEFKKAGHVTSERISHLAGISRQAAHRYLAAMVREKRAVKVGKTRNTYYLPFSAPGQKTKPFFHQRLKNKNLSEDLVFDRISLTTETIKRLPKNAKSILRYAFTEMLNNAIEHSKSSNLSINVFEDRDEVSFEILDWGIGAYNSIQKKYRLNDNFEALQELLKGKTTTAPKKHSGEGVFFTSKIADRFKLSSSKLELVVDNVIGDVFVKDIPFQKGTLVSFQIKKATKKDLTALFNEFSNVNYQFSKTKVTVKLFERGAEYVSRSQGRRLLFGLEKFQTIYLDFKNITAIGQAFADEIFRIFKLEHPSISILPLNAAPSVMFMIKRAQG